ncbi:MAG: transglutaminase domain-containing protein, partial [Bacteroidales bacterium]|nr:transglutaminase domain-containing protein [Bacteroidales bacterium]
LDRGWFTEPARRAMLTHTKAFGHYRGEESVVKKCDYYAEINTLSKYARTKLIHIRVVDNDNKAAENALVEPRLYNYAEFYPLTEIPTDEKGLCSFETGLGDLLVWARKGESFGFEKVSVAGTDTVVIKLGDRSDMNDHYEFDLRAPMERIPFPDTLAKELKAQNTERLRKEDSIRQAYINSWMNDEQAEYLADSLDMDCEIVKDLIGRSMGNYKEIADFLRSAKAEHRDLLIKLLEVISDKDLRDTRASVLEDHLVNTIEYLSPGDYPEDIFTDYILNPRISHEIIKPWRSYIREYFEEADAENFVKDPYELVAWINENITLTCGENYYGVPVSPTGVLKTGSADELSRKILFTAICRTYGIPAGLEKGTNIPVFYSDASWKDIYFDDEEKNETEDAYLAFTYNGAIPVPEYFIHFTLARFKDGRYVTLDYDYNRKVTSFDDYLSLPAGEYMLVTGKRSGKSTVTATLEFFRIEPGEKKTLEIKLKKQAQAARVLATLDLDQVFRHDKGLKPLSSYSEEGLVLIWIDYDKEPGKHVLNNIPLVKDELDELGCQIIFLSDTAEENRSHDPEMLKGLPEKTLFGFDEDMSVLKSVAGKSPDEIRLPYVIYADAAGKIYYLSEGYNIGTGEQILKSILNR